ncbi:PIN domain-containing protein [Jiangella aurantiaca]|uniref:PIN domain-containing protein n=1 Tax=Jiangella aurantiaca TaxID=2530373 RepID=UPI0030845937
MARLQRGRRQRPAALVRLPRGADGEPGPRWHRRRRDLALKSTLAGLEIGRTLLRLTQGLAVQDGVDQALAGIAERHITEDIVGLARRIRAPMLRSLDAIHLATAFVLDADLLITYDHRLADACRHNSLRVAAPGRPTS